MMQFWIKAASALPYTDDVGGGVVTTLLNVASSDISSQIPPVAWDWLNKRSVLPPEYVAFLPEIVESAVREIQRLGDTRLVVSYLHTVWSEWRKLGTEYWDIVGPVPAEHPDMSVMSRLIREELSGIGAAGHRTDLIRRLDYVLLQLDQGKGEPLAKEEYEELRRELLKVDEEAMKILTGTSSSFHPFFVYSLTCPCAGDHSTFSCALPLPCP